MSFGSTPIGEIHETSLTVLRAHCHVRKFFVFTFTLNLVGIAIAASGHWPYARQYTSALILGNIHVSVLVRNELFGRFLYLLINTVFAKVRHTHL